MASEKNSENGRVFTEMAKILLKKGDEKSVAEAVRDLEWAMREGCGEAFCLRGMLSLLGIGCEKDEKAAHETFLEGRKAKCAECCMALADDFLLGRGAERDDGEALKCLKEACDLGSPQAEFFWGRCEMIGYLARRDERAGMSHIVSAASLGLDEACDFVMAKMKEKGLWYVLSDVSGICKEAEGFAVVLRKEVERGGLPSDVRRSFGCIRKSLEATLSEIERASKHFDDVSRKSFSHAETSDEERVLEAMWRYALKEVCVLRDVAREELSSAKKALGKYGRGED